MALLDIERYATLQGFDLKYRHNQPDWPAKWKAEQFSSKHPFFRVWAFGKTAEEALINLDKEMEMGRKVVDG